ncbi:MAG: hypothetical protein ACTSYZ_01775 [Candidatus Helarchaeota archaeon]
MIGRYLEDFKIGEEFITPQRTIHLHDITQFCNLTWFNLSIFYDENYIKENTVWKNYVVPGPFLIALALGLYLKLGLYEKTIIALLGIENMNFKNPLIAGETMKTIVKVLNIRKSTKNPDRGIIHLQFIIKKSDNTFVMSFEMYHLLKCRDHNK